MEITMIVRLKNLVCTLLVCFAVSNGLGLQVQPAQGAQIAAPQADETSLEARIADADLVILGQVRSLQPGPKAPHLSEHNADWQDAVVDVKSFIKGATRPKIVVVRFPASMDIAWIRSPKLKKGERLVFILRRDTTAGTPTTTVDGVSRPVFTALDAQDVLPEYEMDRVLVSANAPRGH
jgi:hypothetical protein